jgi:D-arabinose 1-dehydrogenase-like Zn-dependent alcohol dehydrogenase
MSTIRYHNTEENPPTICEAVRFALANDFQPRIVKVDGIVDCVDVVMDTINHNKAVRVYGRLVASGYPAMSDMAERNAVTHGFKIRAALL